MKTKLQVPMLRVLSFCAVFVSMCVPLLSIRFGLLRVANASYFSFFSLLSFSSVFTKLLCPNWYRIGNWCLNNICFHGFFSKLDISSQNRPPSWQEMWSSIYNYYHTIYRFILSLYYKIQMLIFIFSYHFHKICCQ